MTEDIDAQLNALIADLAQQRLESEGRQAEVSDLAEAVDAAVEEGLKESRPQSEQEIEALVNVLADAVVETLSTEE